MTVTWNNMPEQLEHQKITGASGMGTTYVYIICPYCGYESRAYVWSLAGGGKLCPCSAKHTAYGVTLKPKTK